MNKEEIEARIESMKGLFRLLASDQQEKLLDDIVKDLNDILQGRIS